MSRVSHFKVGLFVLISVGLGFGTLIWIGAAQFFRHTQSYVSFFNESVAGLAIGAEVSYLGVQVGRVTSIGLAPDGRLIRVTLALKPDFKVDHAMALQLGLQGITGQRYLKIGPAPANIGQLSPKIDFPTRLPVIPSYPGELASIEQGLEKALKRIESVDIEGLVNAWEKTARDADALLAGGDLKKTMANLRQASSDLTALLGMATEKGAPQKWRKGFKDLASATAATRRASEALAAQLDALPPNTLGELGKQMNHMVATGDKTVANMNRQVDRSLALLRQSLVQVNRLLAEMTQLMQSLRAAPGRILNRPGTSEPFGR
jgi:ABC-type transporter Mla subunit MlaD